ncbi:G protein-regulated inducer of neurite outgrowth 1 [Leptodactylus fuscus]|uniref:G protein-regulated inducer of neurite outgrowth 1 n=1 Tax=Leptodactylus fuscus TaxID=238119 RepID=UPI003F4F07FA
MGSPKEPQRLQLTRPDGASENISLRSPISSRIWQAEDPTRNSGFDGEDLCMRNFCVSVHGDHELMEGSFSFDTDGDDILEVRRDFSVDADGAYSFHEVREDQSSSKQGDWNFKSDVPQREACSKQSLEGSSNIASDGKEKDLSNSENIMDSQGQILNVPSGAVSRVHNIQGETSGTEKENVNGKLESIQLASHLENQAAECKEVTNGEMSTKTYASNLLPSNSGSDPEEKHYRSIAISPIIPPDGSSSFTFQTGITPFAKHSCGKNDDLPKTYSCELTPAEGDTDAKYRSVAVSPIIPPGETSLFPFHKDQTPKEIKGCCSNETSDTGKQQRLGDGTETKVEYKSVAISPIIPPEGSSSFTFHSIRTVGEQEAQSKELLPKTYSVELIPPNYDVGTQADRAECVSVAVSPIIPPDGPSSFSFQPDLLNRIGGEKSDNISTQSGPKVQYVSVAISPIVLPGGSSSFTFIGESNATEPNKDIKSTDILPKTYSFELTPPDDEPSTSTREYKSVAVSPIIPPEEVSFSFQTDRRKESSSLDVFSKTCSIELTPPNQDVGTQADKVECVSAAVSPIVFPQGSSSFPFQEEQIALHHDQTQKMDSCSISAIPNRDPTIYHDIGVQVDTTVQCASIAVSPMVPLQGSCSFVFHTEDGNQASTTCSQVQEKPQMKDAEMQVSFPVETRSIATDPMTPKGKSPQASYPEVKVKEAKADPPEPVREVSWDEKGMTWEVYGASMEVEVLGMAIQKHLEKQIEEHGRQKVMTPPNTGRGSSVRGAVVKNESKKRQPGTFRTFFRRRPRCCSRAAPVAE